MMILITFCGETFFFSPLIVSILPRRAGYTCRGIGRQRERARASLSPGPDRVFLGRQAGRHLFDGNISAGSSWCERASVCV